MKSMFEQTLYFKQNSKSLIKLRFGLDNGNGRKRPEGRNLNKQGCVNECFKNIG